MVESGKALQAHNNGDWVWVFTTGKVVEWLADGKPKRMVGTHLDINQQKQREILLQSSQTQLRNFFDLSNNFLCIANVSGYFEKVNAAFLQAMGVSESELLVPQLISDCQQLADRFEARLANH